ncbi:MAG: hypothetical protein JXB62_13680 [Pirellulales bacterium]|nr:hypothetical protein [Pirellulales bacterium]
MTDTGPRPPAHCRWCGRAAWWLSAAGKLTCQHCHPPPHAGLVTRRVQGVPRPCGKRPSSYLGRWYPRDTEAPPA